MGATLGTRPSSTKSNRIKPRSPDAPNAVDLGNRQIDQPVQSVSETIIFPPSSDSHQSASPLDVDGIRSQPDESCERTVVAQQLYIDSLTSELSTTRGSIKLLKTKHKNREHELNVDLLNTRQEAALIQKDLQAQIDALQGQNHKLSEKVEHLTQELEEEKSKQTSSNSTSGLSSVVLALSQQVSEQDDQIKHLLKQLGEKSCESDDSGNTTNDLLNEHVINGVDRENDFRKTDIATSGYFGKKKPKQNNEKVNAITNDDLINDDPLNGDLLKDDLMNDLDGEKPWNANEASYRGYSWRNRKIRNAEKVNYEKLNDASRGVLRCGGNKPKECRPRDLLGSLDENNEKLDKLPSVEFEIPSETFNKCHRSDELFESKDSLSRNGVNSYGYHSDKKGSVGSGDGRRNTKKGGLKSLLSSRKSCDDVQDNVNNNCSNVESGNNIDSLQDLLVGEISGATNGVKSRARRRKKVKFVEGNSRKTTSALTDSEYVKSVLFRENGGNENVDSISKSNGVTNNGFDDNYGNSPTKSSKNKEIGDEMQTHQDVERSTQKNLKFPNKNNDENFTQHKTRNYFHGSEDDDCILSETQHNQITNGNSDDITPKLSEHNTTQHYTKKSNMWSVRKKIPVDSFNTDSTTSDTDTSLTDSSRPIRIANDKPMKGHFMRLEMLSDISEGEELHHVVGNVGHATAAVR